MREIRPFFQGEVDALCVTRDGRVAAHRRAALPPALLPGSFNPVHEGHWTLALVAESLLAVPVAFELSALNVDKPPVDMKEIQRRLAQFLGRADVWLTRAPTFVEKASLFPGTTFIVGVDTAERLVAPRYYPDGERGLLGALTALRERRCPFLVAGRSDRAGVFCGLNTVAIPAEFRTLFTAIPRKDFHVDVSSTRLRGLRDERGIS